MSNNKRILVALTIVAGLLAGCAPGPQRPADTLEPKQSRELSEIEQLLLEAETAPPMAKAQYTLEAAQRLINNTQFQRAEDLVNQLNPLLLSEQQTQWLWLLQAELANARQQPADTLDWLGRLQNGALLNEQQRDRIAQLRTATLDQVGDGPALLEALIQQFPLVSDVERAALSERIWQNLSLLDDATFNQLLNRKNDYQTQGWLELHQLSRRPDTDILQHAEALREWLELWSLHPAAQYLPSKLATLQQLHTQPLRHIAILLPQSGKLAKPAQAVIDGLMAAHFQALSQNEPVPLLSFYDSTQFDDLTNFYLQAQLKGVDLIIGPLDKDQLNQLADQPTLGVPTLGMNYVEHSSIASDLYQFGLRGEDEALLAAQKAWDDGHRIALTLTPDTGWGDRILRTFRNEWQRLGGVVADSQRFTGDNDFSERISQLLAVDQSQQRADSVRQLIDEKFEFETRRRQDVDFLFLSALSKDARQIKPTLAFHFAANLPVYATSHIYSGAPQPERDRDLDGIRFSDIPWVLANQDPIRDTLTPLRLQSSSRFGRLYALGADSYRLAPHLAHLQQLPTTHLQGLTGDLQVNAAGEVLRRLHWAEFRNGQIRTLP